ncbi:MAG: hypothetical protein R3E79_60815 [Caldilineaceae bacterium]
MRTNNQTQQAECASNSPEAGFAPATETNIHRTELKVVGHPAGSPGQYTIESIKAGKTSTDTLGSLVGPALVKKLETRQSPLPTIRVIPLEGALAAGLSGAPVLTADDQLVGIGDGSQAEGLIWLIPWSELHLIPVQEAQEGLDHLRALKPDEFFLRATTAQGENASYTSYRGVVKGEQNQPLPDAKVIVQLADQTHRVYTKADGEFLVVLRASATNQQLPGAIRVEKDGYGTYEADVEDLFQQGQVLDIRLAPTVRPQPTTLRLGAYVRVAVLEGAKYYQSATTAAPIGSFAPNVVLALVNGPEQSEASIWWQVRRLEAKAETAVWLPVATGSTVYVEAIDRLGRNDCVATIARTPFYVEAGIDAEYVMVEENTLLRVTTSRLVERDDALWVQVERMDSDEPGWVEYVGTEGVSLQFEDSCGIVTPAATTFPVTAPSTPTPMSTTSPTPFTTPELCTATVIPLNNATEITLRGSVRGDVTSIRIPVDEIVLIIGINADKSAYQIISAKKYRGWLPADNLKLSSACENSSIFK